MADRADPTELLAVRTAAERAYQMAGMGPEDIDCAELHDAFLILELAESEECGLFPKGEAHLAVRRGETEIGGKIPINTSGGLSGYVSSDYMVTCKDSAGSRGDDTVAAAATSLGQQVADYAKQYLGVPYVYGGNGPNSFDCSGFTSYVYRHFGYTINRTASTQLSNGVSVSKSELQPGDLVFFKYNIS